MGHLRSPAGACVPFGDFAGELKSAVLENCRALFVLAHFALEYASLRSPRFRGGSQGRSSELDWASDMD